MAELIEQRNHPHNAVYDMLFRQFGRLTVVEQAASGKYRDLMWDCICECGNHKIVSGGKLRRGHVQSCGCWRHEAPVVKARHGESHTRLHHIWGSMLERCDRPKHTQFKNYGGRGISVCEAWYTYENFRDWANSNGYATSLTIDRIDVNGGYAPENCRWIPMREQGLNKRNNRLVCYQGETKPISLWARAFGIGLPTLRARLDKGMSVEDALNTPVRTRNARMDADAPERAGKDGRDG